MNIYIVESALVGPVNGRLAKAQLTLAAQAMNDHIVAESSHADLVILVGDGASQDHAIEGKKTYIASDMNAIFADPKKILTEANEKAQIYTNTEASLSTNGTNDTVKRIVAVTACPTGVAHTFMAAEAIEEEAKKRGWWCKVETRGSVGVGNELTPEEIASADIVIAACDIEVDLSKFAGKLLYRTKTSPALKKTAQEFDKAFNEAKVYQPASSTAKTTSTEKKGIYQHLLTGISYMLPMVVAGGLIIALAFAFGKVEIIDGVQTLIGEPHLNKLGGLAFYFMVPMLSGYIAYSIADRPGLVPGLIGGALTYSSSLQELAPVFAGNNSGFLGGIVIGYFAGYFVLFLTRYIRLPQSMEALKPILIVPLIATLVTGLVMQIVIGPPIAWVMTGLQVWLKSMGTANAVLLGALLGGMMCTDMGGPINKAAYAFGVGMIASSSFAPMAAVMAGGMVPPLAMSLATFLARKKFAKAERESGKAAFVLGLCFISEGAIPFAARDPLRVIPSCIIGGAIAGGLALFWETTLKTPHGGLFVLAIPGVVEHVFKYFLSIVIGSVVGGVIYALIKRPETKTEELA